MLSSKNVSEEFPYESRFTEILGSKIHYIDEGEGDPILFLHGNPTSSCFWRNIVPNLQCCGRSIAPPSLNRARTFKEGTKTALTIYVFLNIVLV